ncbi:MAG: hypothetical protein EXS31_09405 [Pedosphaera sp.]|nr:hypothetical protein [Pedosphaera sp.]
MKQKAVLIEKIKSISTLAPVFKPQRQIRQETGLSPEDYKNIMLTLGDQLKDAAIALSNPPPLSESPSSKLLIASLQESAELLGAARLQKAIETFLSGDHPQTDLLLFEIKSCIDFLNKP